VHVRGPGDRYAATHAAPEADELAYGTRSRNMTTRRGERDGYRPCDGSEHKNGAADAAATP
jgi:hypothetical protein